MGTYLFGRDQPSEEEGEGSLGTLGCRSDRSGEHVGKAVTPTWYGFRPVCLSSVGCSFVRGVRTPVCPPNLRCPGRAVVPSPMLVR